MIHSAIAFAIGCFWLVNQANPVSHYLGLLLIPALLIWRKFNAPSLFFLLLGLCYTNWHCAVLIQDKLDSSFIANDILVEGVIDGIPQHINNRIRFDFIPNQQHSDLPSKIRLSWYNSTQAAIKPGQHWQLLVRLKPPVGMKNPIPFDYEQWLFQQGIGATGYVKQSAKNQFLNEASLRSVDSIRYQMTHFLEQHINQTEQIGLLQALVTGVKHNITSEQWDILTISGTNHLLAISGLHIGLAAAIGFFCIGWLWSTHPTCLLLIPRQYMAAIGGFTSASFYAAMAGFAIPTQRALIMVLIVLISLCLKRPISAFQTLVLCLLAVLVWDPLAIVAPGFYLSFAAVAIIFTLQTNQLPKPRYIWLKIHGYIALGLTPLLILFFGQTSLIAPIANLIAVPFISFLVVPLVLLAALLIGVIPSASIILFNTAVYLLNLFWPLLQQLASLDFASWTFAALPFHYWLIVLVSVILLLLPRGIPAKWLGIIGLFPLLFYQAEKPKSSEFWFSLLDVGQGLAAVIETKNHTLLFDTGAHFSDSFNAGQHIVLPFIKSKGINQLDAVIISHNDNDHLGGLKAIQQQLKIKQILSSTPIPFTDSQTCLSGAVWQWDEVNFEILHPANDDDLNSNNRSCVLKVSNKNHSLLLTGDIEKEAEKLLLQRHPKKLASTVLIAPHHGSKTSSTIEFINHVNPDLVLIPAGYLNRFKHPHPTVLKRYQHKSKVLTTAENGAILVKISNLAPPQITTWRQQAQKIWTAKLTD